MAKKTENDEKRLISHPPDGSESPDASVRESEPESGEGVLCRADGTATAPPVDQTFLGLFLKVVREDSVPPWTCQQLRSNYEWEITSLGTGMTWEANEMLTSACSAAGADNLLMVAQVNQAFDASAGEFGEYYEVCVEIEKTEFSGIAAASCSELVTAEKSEAAKSSASTRTTVDSSIQYHPVDRCGDWLLYRGLSVSRIGLGNILMLNGEPLQARVLAVAAANVCWEHRLERPLGTVLKSGFVRRAIGDLKFPEPRLITVGSPDPVLAEHPFAFPEAPQYALLVTQETDGRKPFVHVMASECREQPDFVHLNPDKSVRIQVNYAKHENVRSGSFDLWVKVITS